MRAPLSLLAATFLLLAIACRSAIATEPPEGTSERDSWANVEGAPECKDPAEPKCEALRFQHYCRFQGSSYNAVQCAGGRRAIVEQDLNRSYRRLLSDLTKAAKTEPSWFNASKLLGEAQRSWVVSREKECAFVGESFNGGTLQSALVEDCMREVAERRIEAFRTYRKLYSLPK